MFKNINKLLVLVFLIVLTGCVDTENKQISVLNDNFIKNNPLPNSVDYSKYLEDNTVDGFLIIKDTFDQLDCVSFLKYQINTDNAIWNKITLSNLSWHDPQKESNTDIIFYQEKHEKTPYEFDLYCENNKQNEIELVLDIKNEKIKLINKRLNNLKNEKEEANYLVEMHNQFIYNREHLPREVIVAGREVYFGYRSEKAKRKRKIDRDHLYINYTQVSKELCTDMLNVAILNVTSNNHLYSLIDGGLFKEVVLNGEKLTINYKYNLNNVCLSKNDLKFIIYKEYDEDEEES